MKVSVESLGPCKRLVRVGFDGKEVREVFGRVVGEFRRVVRLPGFRAGKAPRHLVVRSFGERIDGEVKRDLVRRGFREAVKEHGLHVVGEPDFEEIEFGRDSVFEFALTVETAPEFVLPEYKGLVARRELREVSEGDVDRALRVLQEKKGRFMDVDRAVVDGDFVVVNYRGFCEGRPIREVAASAGRLEEARDFWVRVGEGEFIKGFSGPLVGGCVGDRREVRLVFPSDFAVKELCGREGLFEVEIVGVKVQELPVLDDGFAREFGADSLEGLRGGVLRDLEAELRGKVQRDVRRQLLEGLMSRVVCDLPESVLEAETRNVVYSIVRENRSRGVSKERIDDQRDEIYSMAASSAKGRVKSAFVLGKIAAAEKIGVSDEEVNVRIVELARLYGLKPERMARQLRERNGVSEIQEQIVRGKVLDFLEAHARIEEVLPSG